MAIKMSSEYAHLQQTTSQCLYLFTFMGLFVYLVKKYHKRSTTPLKLLVYGLILTVFLF